ncbi:MAG: helix-turn-helix domain containing protein [Leptospiraceae bacterium]|nr:helix-turn-helix domain-containing protein [Leptospiraceae bacterium]MCK6380860.1 helix-turn-helix domain containing protein [Leptospiraceae bacterium]
MKDRLKKIILSIGITQSEFAQKLCINISTMSELLTGERYKRLPDRSLIVLNKNYNVNLNWLLTGEGEMFLSSTCPTAQVLDVSGGKNVTESK